jgi:hypothetical protein
VQLPEPEWLLLEEHIRTLYEHASVSSENGKGNIPQEPGSYSRVEEDVISALVSGALIAEGLPIADEPQDFVRIPAGWWVPKLVLPAKYATLRKVDRDGRISEFRGVTFLDFNHSNCWQITADGVLLGFRSVTKEGLESLGALSDHQLAESWMATSGNIGSKDYVRKLVSLWRREHFG